MNPRIKQFLAAAASLGCAFTASAAERNPALDLLVKKGIITAEERAQALEQAAVSKLAAGPREIPWYEKLSIDGYTQFRHTEQLNDAAYLTGGLPADRSVSRDENFVIRRGRFKIAGDFGRLYLYSQLDFAASTGATRFALQARDLYADIALDEDKEHRIRAGLSKVPYGWVNLQSSQNRLAMERPEALNSAVEGERDQGLYYMWASKEKRELLKRLVKEGFKGSGDYGVFTIGGYSGAGLNVPDNNQEPHGIVRFSYPWVTESGQIYELGAGAYHGRFKVTNGTGASGNTTTPNARDSSDGFVDRRSFVTFIKYAQPWGIEAEWTTGQGPQMNDARTQIITQSLQGGYVMLNYRHIYGEQSEFIPFVRWNYFDGARKFATNAPKMCVNEIDVGFEWQWRKEVELQLQYTFSNERSNSSTSNPTVIADSQRLALQLQFNY
ncbi:MAG: porin [Verrucomicrobia bacterium]|nr:porin [Verrucomicrobiota bacterium]